MEKRKKNFIKLVIEGNFFNSKRSIYKKPTGNIIFNDERLKIFH